MGKLFSEFLGTAFLLAAIIGSGITADNMMAGSDGLALFVHAVTVGAILFVLITMLGPLSGAHFNPAVTLAFWLRGEHPARDVAPYIAAQVAGAVVGVVVTRLMFELAPIDIGEKARTGPGIWLGEAVSTFGLMLVILLTLKARSNAVPSSVALYVGAAILFTSSACFANPAVTIARTLSDTFTSIAPLHAPMFIVMQLIGAAAAVGVAHAMLGDASVEEVVPRPDKAPHSESVPDA